MSRFDKFLLVAVYLYIIGVLGFQIAGAIDAVLAEPKVSVANDE